MYASVPQHNPAESNSLTLSTPASRLSERVRRHSRVRQPLVMAFVIIVLIAVIYSALRPSNEKAALVEEAANDTSGLIWRKYLLKTLYKQLRVGQTLKELDIDAVPQKFELFEKMTKEKIANIRPYEYLVLINRLSNPRPITEYLRFDLSAEAIVSCAAHIIDDNRRALDRIVLEGDRTSFQGVMAELAELDRTTGCLTASITFLQNCSPEKDIRDASNKAIEMLASYATEAAMRVDIFEAVEVYSRSDDAKNIKGIEKRLLERTLCDMRRNGLALPADQRNQIAKLSIEMDKLSIDFDQNLNNEDSRFTFTADELKGVELDLFDKIGDNIYESTLKYVHVIPILERCEVESTRQTIERAFNSRCKETNSKILDQLIVLRARHAAILGYNNYADYVLEARMAKSASNVSSFLEDLNERLTPSYKSEMQELLKIKAEECLRQGVAFDNIIHAWDRSYFARIAAERHYGIDQEMVKEYFPVERVVHGTIQLYERLLNLIIEEIERGPYEIWHPNVSLYKVSDASSHELLGHFFLDLFPRPNKYNHFAVWSQLPAAQKPDGSIQYPVAIMLGNFAQPTTGKPALLPFSDVVTFLHEAGHVFHSLCGFSKYPQFSGTNVEGDFVEAPSQFLENFAYEHEPLELLSKHYVTGESIPADLATKLYDSRKANVALLNKRQLVLAIFDQRIHTRDHADSIKIFQEVNDEIWEIPVTNNTAFPASFAHIAGSGYAADYAGYLTSLVYAADMYASKFASFPMNISAGLEYRNQVIGKGGTEDAIDILRSYLGREPSAEPFLRLMALL